MRFEQGLRVHWARFLRRVGGSDYEGSESALGDSLEQGDAEGPGAWERTGAEDDVGEDETDDEKSIDVVVVERSWGRSGTSESASDGDEHKSGGDPRNSRSGDHSGTSTSGEHDGHNQPHHGFWTSCAVLTILRWRLWPAALNFFSPRFSNQKSEDHYRKEIWLQSKVC